MTIIRRLFPAGRAVPIECGACRAPYVGTSCPLCKDERPAYTLLKNLTAALRAEPLRAAALLARPLQPCPYFEGQACGCGQRGECLPAT